MIIKSLTNPLVKHIIKLKEDGKYRKEYQEVIVPGKKMIQEISKIYIPKTIIITHKALLSDINASTILMTTDDVMKKISGLKEPEGILAIFPMPEEPLTIEKKERLLILDGLNDPGNVGTLIRTAYSLNFDGVIFTPNTVDPFNEKAMRAAKGASFFIPLFHKTPKEIQEITKKENLNVYLADIKGKNISSIKFKRPMALILGSESHGSNLSLGEKVTIPMHHNADSLNVAITGGIFMYIMHNA